MKLPVFVSGKIEIDSAGIERMTVQKTFPDFTEEKSRYEMQWGKVQRKRSEQGGRND